MKKIFILLASFLMITTLFMITTPVKASTITISFTGSAGTLPTSTDFTVEKGTDTFECDGTGWLKNRGLSSSGFINLTNTTNTINQVSFSVQMTGLTGTPLNHVWICNNTGQTKIGFEFLGGIGKNNIMIYKYVSFVGFYDVVAVNVSQEYDIKVLFNYTTNSFKLTITEIPTYTVMFNGWYNTDYTDFTSTDILNKLYLSGGASADYTKIHYFSFDTNTTGSGTTPNTDTFYLKFYDTQTNTLLNFKGKNIPSSLMGTNNYIDTYMQIDTNSYGENLYDTNFDGIFPVTLNFTDGDYINIKLTNSLTIDTNFQGSINNIIKYFNYYSITIQVYAGQTYNIFIKDTSYTDGVSYNYCGGYDATNGHTSVCLTKTTFDYGETMRIKYQLPTGAWLNQNGWLQTGWYLAFYNRDDYFIGFRFDNWQYVNRYMLSPSDFDGNTHTYEFDLLEYQNPSKSNTIYGYDKYYNDYEIAIINFNAGIFDKTKMFDGLIFYCTGEDFSPNGTIQSITPNPCYIGQPVTFSWLSNGVGTLEITYPNGEIYFRNNYGYSNGVHTLTKTITAVGNLAVNLYTKSNLVNDSVPVDTDPLICNNLNTNGTYGSYGYGLPYLYIPVYRGIAGYDTIYIYYRTYLNGSKLEIKSPRGETTFFSTIVSNQSDNLLAIELQTYMQLGTWNVTLYGGDINGSKITLNSNFNVVNEENNWIEFSKHQYYTNDPFAVFIKHSYRVALTFYKEDIAQGETIILNVGEQDNTLFNIPLEKITPSAGNWRVEMWRINDRNQIYELAEWTCAVSTTPYITPVVNNFFGFTLPNWLILIIGVVIALVITMIPLIVVIFTRSSQEIPSLLYLGFFFLGMGISVLIGFMNIIIPFIVLLGLIIGFAIMWLRGQSSG